MATPPPPPPPPIPPVAPPMAPPAAPTPPPISGAPPPQPDMRSALMESIRGGKPLKVQTHTIFFIIMFLLTKY